MLHSNTNKRALNNLKHGAFAKATILPGEDPAEFQELCEEIFDDVQPQGVLEEDAALTLAKLLWRKWRLCALRQKNLLSLATEVVGPAKLSVLLDLRASKSASPDRLALDQPPAVDFKIFERELNLEERLDLLIDRAVKRIVQLKTMRSMLSFAAPERPGRPKIIDGPKSGSGDAVHMDELQAPASTE